MRKIQFVNGEYYHLFNRGVDKRGTFLDQKDLDRFFQSMNEFNILTPIGSIYAASFRKNSLLRNLVPKPEKLVSFICYCLCPNHYHLVLQQVADHGIAKFMHRLGLGYTNYFNERYKRSGSLFQGTFKANHIDSDEYLLYVSAYVNLNYKIHKFEDKLFQSSFVEYARGGEFCDKGIILDQFVNISKYQEFAEDALVVAQRRKELEKIIKLDLET